MKPFPRACRPISSCRGGSVGGSGVGGNDTLDGGAGNDLLVGDGESPLGTAGDDILLGGSGDDTLHGDFEWPAAVRAAMTPFSAAPATTSCTAAAAATS